MYSFTGHGLFRSLVFGPSTDDDAPAKVSEKRQQSQTREREARLRPASSIANLIQFARNPVGNVSEAVEDWYDGSTREERAARQAREDHKQLLYLKMRQARTHQEWKAAAKELDQLEGNDEWKSIPDSTEYDVALVEARLNQLEDARMSCDIERMLFLIRTSLTRDLGEMGNLRMYQHSHIGTKDLIERYINTALETLEALLSVSAKAKCDGLESKYILEQVLSARQAFGRSALLLSGGATFGMNHIGVLKALWEARLLPRIISGASAGSIVCAVMCTRTDEEVPHLMDTFCDGDLAVFDDESSEGGLMKKLVRFLKHGALFDINHLTRIVRDMLGDLTFQEAYNRTRRILNICVSSAGLYELPKLLNYVTAPNVLIWSAVAASCSVPFVYTAASLLAKDPKTGEAVPWDPSPQRWIDGSVDNDIPMTRLAEMFNVNHFIVSQVNPHVVPFLTKDGNLVGQDSSQSFDPSLGPGWLENISQLAKGEALHRMRTLAELGVFPNLLTKTVSVLSQKYSGDITIFPEISYADVPRVFSNPTPEYMHMAMLSGQRATWPKLSVIKNHCAIELALDDAVQKLRARVIFSDEEVETRLIGSQQRQSLESKARGGRSRATGRRLPVKENVAVGSSIPPSATRSTEKTQTTPTERHPLNGFTLSPPHKKTRSIQSLLIHPNTSGVSQKSRPSTSDAAFGRANGSGKDATLHQAKRPLYEVTSSGADETSNLSRSSSSTSLDLSSPSESPSSPEESTSKWSRSLFGSSSQPSTPTPLFESLTMSSSSGVKNTEKVSASDANAVSRASSPEPRFKRLFKGPGSGQNEQTGKSGEQPRMAAASNKDGTKSQRRNWGMEIDIPATAKNLVSRGKGKKKPSQQ